MGESFGTRLMHAWNAFTGAEERPIVPSSGSVSYGRVDRPRFTRGNERSIINAVYNRIAMDVAALKFNHVRLDENGRYQENIDSGLNSCLTLNANKDQTGRAFLQDIVMSMLDEGSVGIVPVDTTLNPTVTGSYDVESMRVGRITEWYPDHVRVYVYNDRKGKKEEVTLPKSMVAIVENPLYSVMNEPNSTVQRLIRKLNILDAIDEQSASGKIDLIIQLPYIIKTPERRREAEKRTREIERQLEGSKYGIAYADGTEKITQLNRPVENNLLTQIEYLTNMLYSQLGISQEVMAGTADEKQMLNYTNKTIEPIASAITDAMKWKFLTKTARSQGQSVMFFSDPFKLVPVDNVAEIADKFTRNEIMTSNEFRQVIGMKPSSDPKADELRNSNISAAKDDQPARVDVNGKPIGSNASGSNTDNASGSIEDLLDVPISNL